MLESGNRMFKRFMEPIEGIKKCLINVGSEIDFTAKCICIIFTIRRDVKTGIRFKEMEWILYIKFDQTWIIVLIEMWKVMRRSLQCKFRKRLRILIFENIFERIFNFIHNFLKWKIFVQISFSEINCIN